MAYGKLALSGDQIQDLLQIIQADAFSVGEGVVSQDFDMIHKHMETIGGKVKLERKFKVVLDAGNRLKRK
jgi:hypothetical protein